jgi:hypothetical protein
MARRDRGVLALAAVTLSVVGAWSLFSLTCRDHPFFADEVEYVAGAVSIAEHGLAVPFPLSEIRTYLFPALLTLVPHTRDGVFVLNALLFEGAMLALFWYLLSRLRRPSPLALAAVAFLNPFPLFYFGYALSEAASLAAIIAFTVLLCLALSGESRLVPAFLIGVALGAATMLRPSNLFLLAPLALLLSKDWLPASAPLELRRRFVSSIERALAVAAGCFLLWAPQWRLNLQHHGISTPFVAAGARMSAEAMELSKRMVKCTTVVDPESGAAALAAYQNPLRAGLESEATATRVLASVADKGIKVVGLVDQDRPIPYNVDLSPWYRTPASVLSVAAFFWGLAGIAAETLALWRRQRSWRAFLAGWTAPELAPLFVSGATAAGCLAAFSLYHVDARYGLPAVVLTTLFVPDGIRGFSRASSRARGLVLAAFAGWMALGLSISFWIERGIVVV